MSDLLDYPLGAVRSAFSSILGWTTIIAITTFVGAAVPCCLGEGSLAPSLYFTLATLVLSIFGPSIFLVFGALMGTVLGWSLGLIAESFRFRLVIAVINGAMWAAVSVWLTNTIW
jgi:hypothetical protein